MLSEKNDIFSTTFITIITGVVVFILGQLLLEFILKPLRGYRDLKSETRNKLKYYSNFITNPRDVNNFIMKDSSPYTVLPVNKNEEDFNKSNNQRLFEKYSNISDEIRKLSCDIEVKYYDNFSVVRKIFIKESKQDIDNAVSSLIRISNSLFNESRGETNSNDIDSVRKYLNLN